MSAAPAAVPTANAGQGAQAGRRAIHANRLRAALQQRRQARLAGNGNTSAQQTAATPATRVTIRTVFRISGDRGRHVPFANISPAAQAKRVALMKEIRENWKIANQTWPREIRPVKVVSESGTKRVVSLLPKDMSTNMLEGLCKLSAMTRGHAVEAHKLLMAVVRARSASTGVPFNLQIADVAGAIQKVQEYTVLKRATAARQQGQQTGTAPTASAAAPAAPGPPAARQPAGAETTMSLTASADTRWAEQLVAIRNLYLIAQRRAIAARKQNVTVTLTL